MTTVTVEKIDVITQALLTERERVAAAFARTLKQLESDPAEFARESRQDWEAGTRFRLALWSGSTFQGLVILREVDWNQRSAELAYLLLKNAEGQGLAFEATSKVIDWAENSLGLVDLWARILAGNVRSENLLKRLGFQPDSRIGEDYQDIHGVSHETQRFFRTPLSETP